MYTENNSANRPVIMLVDDEADLVEVLGDALSLSIPNHEIITTSSFDEAWGLLDLLKTNRRQLSLLVVDEEIGDRSGLEVLKESRRGFPKCARLVYTGRAKKSIVDEAESNGAKVLWKPLRLDRLVSEIQDMLSFA